ncbi:hypothetical protein IIC65_05895 [Candidatus Sumerlaeota bacterium]|nr:hypothetical protein [Candidatus Sumerlaeota bacterium]
MKAPPESEPSTGQAPVEPPSPDDPTPSPSRPPRLAGYLGLNLAVWIYLAFQAWILTVLLDSARSIILISGLLGLGFLAVSIFDYLWLRLGGSGDRATPRR